MPDLIYLAAPYSSPSRAVVHQRVLEINLAAAHLIKLGHFVFSPISHTHPIKEVSDLEGNWDFWSAYDYRMLDLCDRLVIFTLPGWRNSIGVTAECRYWLKRKKPFEYMLPKTHQILVYGPETENFGEKTRPSLW